MYLLLDGLSAVVFGGSGKLGLVIARTLFDQGAKVGIHYKTNRGKADELAAELDPQGLRAVSIQADCTDEASLNRAIEKVKKVFGGVDVVVNAVHPPFKPVSIADVQISDLQVQQEGLNSQVFICKSVLPTFRQQRFGRIIFISAGLAVRYAAGMSLFTTTKKGLNGFCQTLAREEGPNNILVNVVSPGAVDLETNVGQSEWDDLGKNLIKNCALGRFATPQEVANAVVFFASPLASGITGQILYISGGEIML